MEHLSLSPLKVLIADHHPLIRAGLRRVLERSDGIEVVGEAASGPELLALIERRRPQLVLTDLRMPGVCGADCIETIRTRWPEVKVVVLSASEDRSLIDAALGAGATTHVLKSLGSRDLASILRQAASGSVFHAAPTFGRVPSSPVEPAGPALTDRERTILQAAAAGLTTAAISRNLWVSEHTVKFHLTNIYRKLDDTNGAGAVRYALEHGLAAA
jgi:DNA-binding NarL/FixJ family response regulator